MHGIISCWLYDFVKNNNNCPRTTSMILVVCEPSAKTSKQQKYYDRIYGHTIPPLEKRIKKWKFQRTKTTKRRKLLSIKEPRYEHFKEQEHQKQQNSCRSRNKDMNISKNKNNKKKKTRVDQGIKIWTFQRTKTPKRRKLE